MQYVSVVLSILGEIANWAKVLVAGVAIVRIFILGLKYNQGDASEKKDSVSGIKQTIYMGGGIFFLVWFAQYVIGKFSAI